MTKETISKKVYSDAINEELIHFNSDAPQKLVDSLSFNGEWHTVKSILEDWGYVVYELQSSN